MLRLFETTGGAVLCDLALRQNIDYLHEMAKVENAKRDRDKAKRDRIAQDHAARSKVMSWLGRRGNQVKRDRREMARLDSIGIRPIKGA